MVASDWDEVETFDDVLADDEKNIISELEVKTRTRCPFLRKEGDFFHYCCLNIRDYDDMKPSPGHPIYQRKMSVVDLQLWCMGSVSQCTRYKTGR